MLALRQLHNQCKKDLIKQWVLPGNSVLDCGCGRGGDVWKWKSVGARVFAIDPDDSVIPEAQERARVAKVPVFFLGRGDIRHAAFAGPYDVVCYNFSVHYIVDCWEESLKGISAALNPGGILIGITPEKARAEYMADNHGHFEDEYGNFFDIYQGGRRMMVKLGDGPFYAEGPRDEPLLDANAFRQALETKGFELLVWEPMIPVPNGLISDLYSTFVFKKVVS
jgi:SAM-dependent methyltransferase